MALRTIGRYEETARSFLSVRAQRFGGCGAEDLTGSDVHEFLLAETERVSVGSAKGRVAELRCLLRFLFIDGSTTSMLAASIPPVAGWRDTALPAVCRVRRWTRSWPPMIVRRRSVAGTSPS